MVLGQVGNMTHVGVTVGRIESPDGRVHEIRGGFNLLVSDRNHPTRFEHPVQSDVSETVLRVSGGNRGETLFQLAAIEYAKVEVRDGMKSTLATLGISVIIALLGTVTVMTATDSW